MGSTIIVGYDGSERAHDELAFGIWLADVGEAELQTIAHVYPPGGNEDAPREPMLEASARARQRLGERRVTFEAMESESAARGVHRLAERDEASLIVVGSSTRGPLGRLLAGNVAERLLAGAPCSVAVTPTGRPESRRALEAALELAERANATVRIVSVVDPDPVGHPRTVSSVGYGTTEWLIDMRQTFEQMLAEVAASVLDEVRVETAVLVGDAAEMLAAQELDALFCGSRGCGFVGQVLLGGTSARRARRAKSPVIIVPRTAPPGFVGRRADAARQPTSAT